MSAPRLGARYPLLTSLNRLIAVRWLRALGHDVEAARLLTWQEAIPPLEWLGAWTRSIGGLSLVDRGESAEALGQTDQARTYYTRFLRQYDMPVAALRPRVDRAEAALARLVR